MSYVNSDSLRKEIRRLLAEAAAEREADPLGAYPDWPLRAQLDQVECKLRFYAAFESKSGRRYEATDREVYCLGIWCALWELGSSAKDGGEYTFERTGLTIKLTTQGPGEAGEDLRISGPRRIVLDDLPEWVARYFERLAPEEQGERDAYLYARRHDAKEDLEELRQMQARASES